MTYHVRFLRKGIRLLFGRRAITIRGEGAIPLSFPPWEYPSLLIGLWAFEPEVKRRWKALLSPGEVIYDIGANIGLTMQRFHALLSGACAIHAFEPLPRNLELLRQNIAGLGQDVRVVAVAVGNKNGRTSFEDNLDHGALSRLKEIGVPSRDIHEFWGQSTSIDVDLITLDRYCDDHPEAAPTFIKLDVEGAGHLVMQGGKSVLSRFKPVVSCSFHGREERNGIIDVLASQGYRGIKIRNDGTLTWCDLEDSVAEFGHPDYHRIASRINATAS